jgi:tRNA A37 N6-isopentenylltransferase MiaA
MIEASQRMITDEHNNSPSVTKHMKLQIKTLQNAPREADSLKRLLKVKEREKQEAMHIEDTQRLVIEIEMLKVVLRLVRRDMCAHARKQPLKLGVILSKLLGSQPQQKCHTRTMVSLGWNEWNGEEKGRGGCGMAEI